MESNRVKPFYHPVMSDPTGKGLGEVTGSLLLTDKRMILGGLGWSGSQEIFFELVHDPDLANEMVRILAGYNSDRWKQHDSAGFFSKNKILMSMYSGVSVFTGVKVNEGIQGTA